MDKDGKFLILHQEHSIKRHTKVRGPKSPFDGDLFYWASRMGKHPEVKPQDAKLLKSQKGKCGSCGLYFQPGDTTRTIHIDGNKANKRLSNLNLVHGHCHDKY